MSPLLRDRLRIVLCEDRVVLVRQGFFLKKSKARAVLPCSPANGWVAALGTLAIALETPQWQHTRATVVLSNAFVHYLPLPWSDHLVSDDEQHAFVLHRFTQVFGDCAAGWEFRWSGDDNSRLASAVDKELLAALEKTLVSKNIRLHSVQPYLMSALNYWRGSIKEKSVWLALSEPGRFCLAFVEGSNWKSVRSIRTGEHVTLELSQELERAKLLISATAKQQKLVTNLSEGSGLSLDEGWSVQDLNLAPVRGALSPSARDYAMALVD